MSLHPQTIRIRHRLREWTRSGRKQWDIYRYLYNPFVIHDALKLIVKNGGASGVDGKTIKSIQGHEWDFVRQVLNKLQSGTYKPSSVRRCFIPKANGEKRPLGIPTLVDRVIQRAVVLLMEPVYEEKFNAFSFGFRPKKRAVDAVFVAAKECYQHRYVFEADIEKFFDEVNHRKLVGMLKHEIVDTRLIGLIIQYLRAGFCEVGKPWVATKKGTPQGGPLSPMLANIYLHYILDENFQKTFGNDNRVKLIRYADDFVVLTQDANLRKLIEQVIRGWLGTGNLKLKETKTRWVDMTNESRGHRSKFEFLGFKIHLRSFKDNPKRFWIARQPSESSRKAVREAVKSRLHVGMTLATAKLTLKETWRGWCEYFKYSNGNRILYRDRKAMKRIYYWWLCRKFRRQRRPVPKRKLFELRVEYIGDLNVPNIRPNHFSEDRQTASSL